MKNKRFLETVKGFLFILPWLIGFFVFLLGPILFSLYSSFTYYDITSVQKWTGLRNYVNILTNDARFLKALGNTVYYVVFSVPLVIALALTWAALLNMKIPFRGIFRAIFYFPSILSGVAVSLLWMWIFEPSGGIANAILNAFGIPGIGWYRDAFWSKPTLIFMRLWAVGGTIVIFLAALQDVPRHLYEAAEIDGASTWRKIITVTIPMISPKILFVAITGVNAAFQIFDNAYIISNGKGEPADSTLFYNLYLYIKAFNDSLMGYACALAWILFLIILAFTGIQLYVSKRWVYYESEK